MNKEDFIQAAQLERLYLVKFCAEQNIIIDELTPVDGFDAYDAIISTQAESFVVEVKVREYKSTDWSTWQIQKDKFDHLMDIYNYSEGQLTPVYINFHPDGCRVFELLDYKDIEWQEQMLPKSKFDSTLISKIVGYLASDKGKFYPGINNITEEKLKIKQQNQRIKSEDLKNWILNKYKK
jgi:hypothetical protein